MALGYHDVYSMALVFAITNLAAILIFLSVVIFAYPALIINFLKRWTIFWYGFKVKKLKVDENFTFAYMEKGDISESVPSLLLLHGMFSSKDMFCSISKYLPVSRMHIIALDFPGHGNSSGNVKDHCSIDVFVSLLEKFIQLSGLEKKQFHLGGLSLGGFITGLYAARKPSCLLSAILMCPAGIESPERSKFAKDFKNMVRLPWHNDTGIREMMGYASHARRDLNGVLIRAITAYHKQGEPFFSKFFEHVSRENVRHALTSKLEAIKVPTLVVWGKDDKLLHVSAVDVFKEKIPHCKIEVFDDCGHVIMEDKPRELATVITDFINAVDKKTQHVKK